VEFVVSRGENFAGALVSMVEINLDLNVGRAEILIYHWEGNSREKF
jgi:hypothetical protein